MDKISTILVPFDFSVVSKTALDYAVNYVGTSTNMAIKLVYANPGADSETMEKEVGKLLKKYGKKLQSPLSYTLSSEPLNKAILQARKDFDADLIIMGTAGTSEQERADSHTSQLVMEAKCPVLVIPEAEREFQVKNIVLVLGRDEIEDTKVLATLLDVARRFNAKVHVLTIKNEAGTYGYSKTDELNERFLEYYLESFYSDHTYIENPDVVEGIADYTANKEIDMIAILPRIHSKRTSPSEGRLTQILTLKSRTPVLAIE